MKWSRFINNYFGFYDFGYNTFDLNIKLNGIISMSSKNHNNGCFKTILLITQIGDRNWRKHHSNEITHTNNEHEVWTKTDREQINIPTNTQTILQT